MANEYDHAYKQLFSHRDMMWELLSGFVKADWLRELDPTTLEKVNGNYITADARARANDLVWKVRWREEWVYIYLLMEFQSTVDKYMAVRMLTYAGLLYQDLIHSKQLPPSGKLPPILPMVLYNGFRHWQAPLDLASMFEAAPDELVPYLPQARYLLLDEGRYPQQELASQRNVAAAMFRMENCDSPGEIKEVLADLAQWLGSDRRSLEKAFLSWIHRVILPKLPGDEIVGVHDLKELNTMLAERMEQWPKRWKREGLKEGRKEGRQEGRQEGRREGRKIEATQILSTLLQQHFGQELPSWAINQINDAEPEQLEAWIYASIKAESLEELFGIECN